MSNLIQVAANVTEALSEAISDTSIEQINNAVNQVNSPGKYTSDLVQLATNADGSSTIAQKAVFGLQTLLIGMGIVFGILILLWIVLEIFGFIARKLTAKSLATKAETAAIDDSSAEETPAEPITEAAEEDEDESELIAVITAAIEAARSVEAAETGFAPGEFRVVSFKKRAW
ncbi:hypothetical protein FACS1894105_06490 [Clostridia bacterium]|nr:hypothetical protein FACS1894105_06490 [Clostridia bacterium]